LLFLTPTPPPADVPQSTTQRTRSPQAAATTWPERERHLARAFELVAAGHNELGLTEPLDTATRYFHDRPFRVLGAGRFAEALLPTIGDPALRALYPIGAIDQYVDCTDLTSAGYAERRRRYLAGRGLTDVTEPEG
jgi:hypothetical protein